MLTAHLPAGYCLTRLATGRRNAGWAVLAIVLVCSVLPDFDLFFFYFVDGRSLHHHRYWVHIPAFWAAVAAITLPIVWRTRYRLVAILGFAAIILHLVLDTIAGGILWLAPFDTTLYRMTTVPAIYSHVMISFILHWTFLLEFVVWGLALGLYVAGRRQLSAVSREFRI